MNAPVVGWLMGEVLGVLLCAAWHRRRGLLCTICVYQVYHHMMLAIRATESLF